LQKQAVLSPRLPVCSCPLLCISTGNTTHHRSKNRSCHQSDVAEMLGQAAKFANTHFLFTPHYPAHATSSLLTIWSNSTTNLNLKDINTFYFVF